MSDGEDLQMRVRDVDLRGFVDALQPIRLQSQWSLDHLQQKLAVAKNELSKAEYELAAATTEIEANAAVISTGLLARIHPESYRQGLAYLVSLHQKAQHQRDAISQKRLVRDQVCAEIARLQRRLEAFDLHRDTELDEFASEARRRVAAEQDQDWLAGVAVRGTETEVVQ